MEQLEFMIIEETGEGEHSEQLVNLEDQSGSSIRDDESNTTQPSSIKQVVFKH